MPDCNENYESEIENGKNIRSVKCRYCNSTILTPETALFETFEVMSHTFPLPALQIILILFQFKLPNLEQKKSNVDNPETELVTLFWRVNDMFAFQNVGFSNTVGNNKYLTCADCEAGPIGYYDIESKKSYVALSRVVHA